MDWRRQLVVLRGWLGLLIVIAIATAGIAYGASGILPKVYEARATLIVGQSLSAVNPDYTQLLASQRLSETYSKLATTRPILEKVIADLKLSQSPTDLQRKVAGFAAPDSALLTVTASAGSPAEAAAIANAIAMDLVAAAPNPSGIEADVKAFISDDLRATQADIQSTQADVNRLLGLPTRTAGQENELNVLQSRLTSLRSSFATLLQFASSDTPNILSIVEQAVPPDDAISPRPLLNAGLAAVLAVLVAVLLILLAAYLDDGLKNADIVREVLDLPTLAMVPRMPVDRGRSEIYRLTMLLRPKSAAAEAFRSLRTNLEFTSVDTPLRLLLVTSPSVGEGKTVTAANLAVAYAEAGRRVLLVDGDLRKPGVGAIFNAPPGRGLSDLLRADGRSWQAALRPTEVPNLMILTAGALPPNPAELLSSHRMKALLDSLKEAYELVIVDAPPLLPVADASILSAFVDGVLFVVDARRTRRDAARRALESLTRAGARGLGVVVNRLRGGEEEFYAAY